jgi:hypothetical protein
MECIVIVVLCVPKRDESFGSVVELGPSTSGEGQVADSWNFYNIKPSVCVNDGNAVPI